MAKIKLKALCLLEWALDMIIYWQSLENYRVFANIKYYYCHRKMQYDPFKDHFILFSDIATLLSVTCFLHQAISCCTLKIAFKLLTSEQSGVMANLL